MSMFGFPLLLIPLAVVNIIAFLMPGVSLGAPLHAVPLTSGVSWTITFSDALVAFSMLLLFFEVAKATRPGGKYLTDHLLSFLVFAGATAEFVLLSQFGNSTFFLLTMLAFVDFISGIAIRLRWRSATGEARARARVAPQRTEPTLAPAPVPQPMPAPTAPPQAARAHDSVLELEHPADAHQASHDNSPASESEPKQLADQNLPPRS
jgi:hypothetical protein